MECQKKVDEIPSGYDASHYELARAYATAADGTQVPMSIVYKKGMQKDGSNPTLLYGYGSYGASMEAAFNANRLSLLDRGFVYVIGASAVVPRWDVPGMTTARCLTS